MKRWIGVFLSAALFLGPACKKTSKLLAEKALLTGDSGTMYVAGGLMVQDPVSGKQTVYGICWKNGVATALTTDKTSFITCITVDGNDVYVGGAMTTSRSLDMATYWKNGNPVTLTDGTTNARVTGIAINGPDVYAVGSRTSPTSGNPVATCWKNGVAEELAGDAFYSVANGVAVSGSDVYVVGQFMNGHLDSSTIMVWKNGVAQPLSGYPFSYAMCVAFSGSDIYLGGTGSPGIGYSNGAAVWKDGILEWVFGDLTAGQVNSLALSGNDNYAVGFYTPPGGTQAATWWKNGVALSLSGAVDNTVDNTYADGIAISGQNIFISGGAVSYSNQNNSQAFCWVNGVRVTLKNSVAAPIQNGTDSTGLYTAGVAIQPGPVAGGL